MSWLILALVAAVCVGISDIIAKNILKKEDPYLVALGKMIFAAPLLLPILFIVDIPALTPVFWKTVAILAPLEITAIIFYMKGIQISPISLTVPFLSFTPVFIIFTGFLMLGEVPTLYGALGIVFVVAGAYILNIRNWRRGILAPFKAIFEEKGSVCLLVTALIYSITSVLGKKAILASDPIFFAGFYTPFIALFLLPIAIKKSNNIKKLVKKPGMLIVIGILLAITAVCHFKAISMVEAAYMIAVKRSSILISTVIAYFVYRDDHIREHLLGAGIMFLGVVVIMVLG